MHCRLVTQYAIIMVLFLAGLRKIKLRAGAISRVSFLDLFGPIAGTINPVM